MILIGLPTVLAACLWLWPLTRRLLRGSPHFEPLAFFTGLGLSLGLLSLAMLWIGLLPGAWLRPWIVLPIPWIGLLISAWVERDRIRAWIGSRRGAMRFDRRWWLSAESVSAWLALIGAGALFAIAVNLISYPFYTTDVLVRYAPNARTLFTQAHVPPTLVGYPLGVQMLYAFGFMAAGLVNDHVAGAFGAALVIGMVGTVWAVARLLFSNRAAWAAVVLTLGAPVFVNWSTSGYVDIPNGFYHGLTFAMAYLWLRRGERRYAILAGVFGGLALWVKHSSLVIIPALAAVPLLRLWPLSSAHVRREIGRGALSLAVLGLVAAPWFVRSYLLAGPGAVFPAPSTYDALFVDHSLNALIAFWYRRGEWGVPMAAAVLAGMTLWAAVLVWPRLAESAECAGDARRVVLLWAAFVIPYHLIWWWGFTYQARYLFTSLAMYAAVAGFVFDWSVTRFGALQSPRFKLAMAAAGMIVSAALVGNTIRWRLGAVYYLVTDPARTDDAKLTRLARDSWLVSKYVRETIPPGAKLYVMDSSLAYWLYNYELQVGYPSRLDDLRGYDYYVVARWGDDVLSALGSSAEEINQSLDDPALFTKLFSSGEAGQTIYAVNFR
ncbi:MAG TPA: glycosyltransferase family 39 protein [Anaerolineales bacterium]|nr:glycosyltransferase family 39 protein [Anaerolineales bacterium]